MLGTQYITLVVLFLLEAYCVGTVQYNGIYVESL